MRSLVDGALLQLLARHKAALLSDAAAAQALLEPCVLVPTPERSEIASLLLSSRAECRQLFEGLLPRALSAAPGASSADQRRETLALLLPQAIAYLQRAEQPAGDCAVAAAVAPLLLAFLAAKQRSEAEGGASRSPAAALLHAHALPCLQLLLQRGSVSPEQWSKLLRKVLPSKGWPTSEAACDSASLFPSTALKAGAAAVALEGGGGGVESLHLCAQAFTATLSTLFK